MGFVVVFDVVGVTVFADVVKQIVELCVVVDVVNEIVLSVCAGALSVGCIYNEFDAF